MVMIPAETILMAEQEATNRAAARSATDPRDARIAELEREVEALRDQNARLCHHLTPDLLNDWKQRAENIAREIDNIAWSQRRALEARALAGQGGR